MTDPLRHLASPPRWGWHDDHRAADGTPAYLPAVQQVWSEFCVLRQVLDRLRLRDSCLQLGLGPCDAPHALWRALFAHVVSVDRRACLHDDDRYPGLDTRDPAAATLAEQGAPYDMLFVDAGHSCDDAAHDHRVFGPMVRPGGLVVFHDALPRAAYPEVEVWRYLADLEGVTVVGDEVGTAWL